MSSAARLTEVLGLFTLKRPAWTPLAAAESLGISRASAYRYFSILLEAGLINDAMGRRFVLGPRIIELDRQIRLSDPIVQIAVDEMVALAKHIDGEVLLCRMYNGQVLCIHQERDGPSARSMSYERGRPVPLYRGATSKIILAFLPVDELNILVQRDRLQLASMGLPDDTATLHEHLEPIREQRICTDYGEVGPGCWGAAVPICIGSRVIGSLGIALRTTDAEGRSFKSACRLLTKAGLRIDAELEE